MKILGTGFNRSGRLKIRRTFKNAYEFEYINLDNGINILDKDSCF